MRFPENTGPGQTVADGRAEFTLRLDPGLMAFKGHFPGNPILPGVMQVDWAVHFAALAFGPMGAFKGVDFLKFMDPIRPGGDLRLELTLDASRTALKFTFLGGDVKKSTGVIRFSGEGID